MGKPATDKQASHYVAWERGCRCVRHGAGSMLEGVNDLYGHRLLIAVKRRTRATTCVLRRLPFPDRRPRGSVRRRRVSCAHVTYGVASCVRYAWNLRVNGTVCAARGRAIFHHQ